MFPQLRYQPYFCALQAFNGFVNTCGQLQPDGRKLSVLLTISFVKE